MRVSDKMQQTQVLKNINKNRSEISNLQNQAATQKQITKPSDDPIGTAKVLKNRSEMTKLSQFDKNIFLGKSFLDMTESTLAQMGESIQRARELAMQAANDTNSGQPREMIAAEVEQIYDGIIEMGNRRFADKYIFAGFKTMDPPFTREGQYVGDDGQIQVQNHDGQFMPINLVGAQVFLGQDLTYGGNISREQVIPKSVEELQKHKMDLVEADFIKQEIEETEIETRGPASIGRVQRANDHDPVTHKRGVNIFQTVQGLEAALKTNDKTGIQQSLDGLDQALNQINLARAEVGGRTNQLTATSEGIQRSIVDVKSYNSQIEDADAFQVMTDINKNNQILEATLATSGKMVSQTLLDFLK